LMSTRLGRVRRSSKPTDEGDNLEEAVEIAASHPMAEAGTIEVRPLWGS
jgi:hypothetical protein